MSAGQASGGRANRWTAEALRERVGSLRRVRRSGIDPAAVLGLVDELAKHVRELWVENVSLVEQNARLKDALRVWQQQQGETRRVDSGHLPTSEYPTMTRPCYYPRHNDGSHHLNFPSV